MTIQDNRAAWFAKTAPLREMDDGGWLCRFVHGRHVQARIQPKDLTLERLLSLGRKPANVADLNARRRRKA